MENTLESNENITTTTTTITNTLEKEKKNKDINNLDEEEFVNTQKPENDNVNMNVDNKEKEEGGEEEEDDDLFGDKSMEVDNVEGGEEEADITTSKKKSKKQKNNSSNDNDTLDDIFDKEEEIEKKPSRSLRKRLKTINNPETENDFLKKSDDYDVEQQQEEEDQQLLPEGTEQESSTKKKKKDEDPDYEEDYSEPEDKKKRKRSSKPKKDSKKERSSKKEKSSKKKKSSKTTTTTTTTTTTGVEGEGEGNDEDHEQEGSEEPEEVKKENPLLEFEKRKKVIKKIAEEDADVIAHAIIDKMRIAAKQDTMALKQGKPALHKLLLLPEVDSLLHKKDLYNPLIDEDIYAVITSWLSPLPNIKIKLSLLKILANLPYDPDKIFSCGILEHVKSIRKNEKETPDVRQLAYNVIDKWTRPSQKNSNDYNKVQVDLKAIHNQSHTVGVESDGALTKKKSDYLPTHIKHATGCQKVKLDYTVRPVSKLSAPINSPMRAIHKIDKEIEKLRTPSIKGSPRAQTISIEGKGMVL